jgi:hypothetical protein
MNLTDDDVKYIIEKVIEINKNLNWYVSYSWFWKKWLNKRVIKNT